MYRFTFLLQGSCRDQDLTLNHHDPSFGPSCCRQFCGDSRRLEPRRHAWDHVNLIVAAYIHDFNGVSWIHAYISVLSTYRFMVLYLLINITLYSAWRGLLITVRWIGTRVSFVFLHQPFYEIPICMNTTESLS